MLTILLEFQFKDILNWVGGLIAFGLFFVVCYFIGQLGVQIRSGINILKYINKAERDGKAKGMIITEKGISLKKKGRQKIILPSLGIFIFYTCVLLFVSSTKYQIGTLFLLIPIALGFFGIFLVPEQLEGE